MAFEISQFSTKGLELLGQLSSHKSLVIKRIFASETQHSASDFDQTPFWWAQQTSSTGSKVRAELASAGHDKDTARLTVKFTPLSGTTTETIIKTIVIEACSVESGTQTEDIIYCGVSDSKGITVLGFRDESIQASTAVSLYFKFNNASSITVETNENPDFVLHSEMDRFLSCHKVGDETSGDEQWVYGNKYFLNGISLDTGQTTHPFVRIIDDASNESTFVEVSKLPQESGLEVVYRADLLNDDDRVLAITLDNDVPLCDLYKTKALFSVPVEFTDALKPWKIAAQDGDTAVYLQAHLVPHGHMAYDLGEDNAWFDTTYTSVVRTMDIFASEVYVSSTLDTNDMFATMYYSEKEFTTSQSTEKRILTSDYNTIEYYIEDLKSHEMYGHTSISFTNGTIEFATAGKTGNTYNSDSTLMSMSLGEIQVRQPTVFFESITVPSAKVSIENGYQIVTGIPLEQKMQHPIPDIKKFDAIGVGVGCIVGAYDTVSSFTGSSAIKYLHPGTRIIVRKGQIHLAMCAGSINESAMNSWYPCGHNANYSGPTGIEDLYLPEGHYVTCTGAVAQQNTTEYVFVLLLRIV